MTESKRKVVSVITGTYNRPHLLAKCIQQIQEQTYKQIEHCIVHDGPAHHNFDRIIQEAMFNESSTVTYKVQETGRQWSQFLTRSISAVPYQVAQWLASGDYLMWLADDEEIAEDHIESLVDLLESEDVDFVYSQTQIWFNPELGRVLMSRIIGDELPLNGNITHTLFRAELLDYRGFMTHVGSGTDIDQIAHWIDAGASWAFLPRVTHTHRVDKFGDGLEPPIPLTLRGHTKAEKPYLSYVGKTINNLTVLEFNDNGTVRAQCACGNVITTRLSKMLTGQADDCGLHANQVNGLCINEVAGYST